MPASGFFVVTVFQALLNAATPTAARILFSISCAISGLAFRNSRALSLPWPIFSPL